MTNQKMLKYVVFILFFISMITPANAKKWQPENTEKVLNTYFEHIRNSPVPLRQFLLELPKGGDLHNHMGGSIYAETLIDVFSPKNMYVNPQTGILYKPNEANKDCVPLSDAYKDDSLYESIITNWSMFNFHPFKGSANDHFFNIFGKIRHASTEDFGFALAKLRGRAAAENMMYLEISTSFRECAKIVRNLATQIGLAEQGNNENDEKRFLDFHEKLVESKTFKDAIQNAIATITRIKDYSDKLLENDPGSQVDVRFQCIIIRVMPKLLVLSDVIAAFEIAQNSDLVVGINIAAPENNYTARTDYQTHMKMISIIGKLYPEVKRSLHAGELTLGLAVPEALRFHIKEAVDVAGADRIGHATDIAYESDALETIKKMRDKEIAVEILLTSNEQLLGVKGEDHPFHFYVESGVPVVLAGDDPGMMRTTQTQEFYLAATRYPSITYSHLKGFVQNSIKYSFLEPVAKEKMMTRLEEKFKSFEAKWKEIATKKSPK